MTTETAPPDEAHGAHAAEVADRLRLPVTRLARLLRQQDTSGLGPTLSAALATIHREGPLSLSDLAASERVATATMSRAVGKLEARDLVRRAADPTDRRSCLLTLSPAGEDLLARNRHRRTAWLATALATLDAVELERIDDVVDLIERLTSVAAEPAGRPLSGAAR